MKNKTDEYDDKGIRFSEMGRPLAEDSARRQRLDTPTTALRRSPLADSIADRLRENRERRMNERKRHITEK